MIIREWRGRAAGDRVGAYPEHFRGVVLPELRTIDGFRGATLCRRAAGNGVEYLVLTRWASLEAIRAFTGAKIEKAVIEPGAVAALSDFDQTATHYDVLEERTAD